MDFVEHIYYDPVVGQVEVSFDRKENLWELVHLEPKLVRYER
jgi:hypothetical protein